jgi:Mg2+ and Co2+ transporter CorA
VLDNKECPYIETRLEINNRIKGIEKDLTTISSEVKVINAHLNNITKEMNEKIERILDCLNTMTTRNGIQDRDINTIMEELRERKNLNRWTADKVITILTSILSPLLVALLLAFFKAR